MKKNMQINLERSVCVPFVPFKVSPWNDLSDHVLYGVGLMGFKSIVNGFLLA